MDSYSFLRQLADSWGLALMTLFFVGIVFYVFRSGGKPLQDEAARSIFQNDKRPAPYRAAPPPPRKEA